MNSAVRVPFDWIESIGIVTTVEAGGNLSIELNQLWWIKKKTKEKVGAGSRLILSGRSPVSDALPPMNCHWYQSNWLFFVAFLLVTVLVTVLVSFWHFIHLLVSLSTPNSLIKNLKYNIFGCSIWNWRQISIFFFSCFFVLFFSFSYLVLPDLISIYSYWLFEHQIRCLVMMFGCV